MTNELYRSEYYGKGGIFAKVVKDSVSPDLIRLTTLELKYPRFIHSEFMTHRVFSRNASSSRAIPVKRILGSIETQPAMPIHWGKNRPGMQAREEHDWHIGGELSREVAWTSAAREASSWARMFDQSQYHKQIVNRLTEPFQFIHVVVTATEWDNFFNLRLHEDAQPEIHELARCMFEAMEESTPTLLHPGEWHLPYWTEEYDLRECTTLTPIKASIARCARVSYKNHDNSTPDIIKDMELADRLLKAGHMSPFEHQATPMKYSRIMSSPNEHLLWDKGITHKDINNNLWSSNFRGWIQYRNLALL